MEDADSAGPSAFMLFSWISLIFGLFLPFGFGLLWMRVPLATRKQTLAQVLLFVFATTIGQVAFANRFSPIYMHRKENALMYFIRASIKVATEGIMSKQAH